MSTDTKRDLVLPPGTYAYMQDTTKGVIKTYTGPTVINPTAQEVPVVYDAGRKTFSRAASLEDAQRVAPTAPEGTYLVLHAPAKGDKHPTEGSAQPSDDLLTGRKVVVPGPATFALWPGQVAEVVAGHHLRSNQYLLVRVYNEDEAKKNWAKAVVKPASSGENVETSVETPVTQAPADLTVGKLLIIKGTEVSFYIPPTGIEVVNDRNLVEAGGDGYVRDALTLERLEYAILVDENGKKRYERGPQVVFPLPSERFIESRGEENKGFSRKSRAIELNEIQGIHLKVIAPYTENGKTYREGEELFITGKDTAIYFPREEHSAVKYDGKTKHFATAIPAGEARYVMNRNTGEIRTVKGPAMLLPDPRSEVIVRRVLSDKQATLWYPGNTEALEYNRALRAIQAVAPTTRQGAVSEGDFERGMARSAKKGLVSASASVMYNASVNAAMDTSLVGGEQNLAGDEFSRASNYTQPRTVTLDTKYQGAPNVDIWTSYAVMVVSKTGKRRVERGPTTVLLDYDEGLEVLELSTGKPKTTDQLLRTAYLLADNNKVTDYINVETSDHVNVKLYLSYRVNFEGPPEKWFAVQNYIKLLCDHARSILKGSIRKLPVEAFYSSATDHIRDLILGPKVEGEKRAGMKFEENGMRVVDIEVLQVELLDKGIAEMLNKSQQEVVRTNIELSGMKRQFEFTKEKETIQQATVQASAQTKILTDRVNVDLAASTLAVKLAAITNTLREVEESRKTREAEETLRNMTTKAQLDRVRQEKDQEAEFFAREQMARIEFLKAEAEAVVTRFSAATPGFTEAILALSHNETLVKVAEAWNIQRALGGESVVDSLAKVFQGTPLGPLVAKLTTGHAIPNGNGNGSHKPAPIS